MGSHGDSEPERTIITGKMVAFHHPDTELAGAERAPFIFCWCKVQGKFVLFIQVTWWWPLLTLSHLHIYM